MLMVGVLLFNKQMFSSTTMIGASIFTSGGEIRSNLPDNTISILKIYE